MDADYNTNGWWQCANDNVGCFLTTLAEIENNMAGGTIFLLRIQSVVRTTSAVGTDACG